MVEISMGSHLHTLFHSSVLNYITLLATAFEASGISFPPILIAVQFMTPHSGIENMCLLVSPMKHQALLRDIETLIISHSCQA